MAQNQPAPAKGGPAAKTDPTAPADPKEGEKKAEDELARIAILPFEDRTNSKNFVYLSESLVNAIVTSMTKEFAFERIDPKEIKKAVFNAQQEITRGNLDKKKKRKFEPAKRVKATTAPADIATADNKESKDAKAGEPAGNKPAAAPEAAPKEAKEGETKDQAATSEREKTPEEIAKDEQQLSVVQIIAKDLPAEIVIFGNYIYDNDANEVVFEVNIYMTAINTVRELEDTRNPVDNTIFKATEKVAKALVAEIYIMVEEAQKALGEKKEEPKEVVEETGPKKVAISRKIANAPVLDWKAKKIAFTLSPAFSFFPASYEKDFEPVEYGFTGGMAEFRFWPVPNLSLSLAYKNIHYRVEYTDGLDMQTASHEFEFHQAIAYAGYSFILQKLLRFNLDVGAGYYLGSIRSWYNSGSPTDTFSELIVYNPVFSAKVGTDVLLLPNMSAGFGLVYSYLYDDPYPVQSLDLLITIGVVF